MFSSISPWATGIKHGVIWGVITILVSLLLFILGMDLEPWVRNLGAVYVIGVFISTIIAHRKNDLGGYINFSRAFSIGMIALGVMALIGTVYSIFYMYALQPDIIEKTLKLQSIAMEERGMSEAQIRAASKWNEPLMKKPILAVMAFFLYAFFGAIFGLIISAIMGSINKPPDGYTVPQE